MSLPLAALFGLACFLAGLAAGLYRARRIRAEVRADIARFGEALVAEMKPIPADRAP